MSVEGDNSYYTQIFELRFKSGKIYVFMHSIVDLLPNKPNVEQFP